MALLLLVGLSCATQDSFEACDGRGGGGDACIQAIIQEDPDIADVWGKDAVPHVQKTSEQLRKHQNPVMHCAWVWVWWWWWQNQPRMLSNTDRHGAKTQNIWS